VTRKIYRPTVLTLLAVAIIVAVIAGTAGFILGRAPLLGSFIPVRFDATGAPDRWVVFSYSLVLLPVWIQLALAVVFATLGSLLLYRTNPRSREGAEDEVVRQERERMLATAEAAGLLTAIWVVVPRIGVVATTLLLFSPIVWWIDKPHTEVYTVSLLAIALALMRDRPWWSMVLAGLAATQNPPIAVLVPIVGIVALHVLRGLADDDGELAFVVHELHVGRAVRVLAVADERALALDEHQRLFGGLEFEFLRVVGVVEAEREDGAGACSWRERGQPGELVLRHDAAVVQAHGSVLLAVEFVARAGVLAAFEDDACVLHAASFTSVLLNVSNPGAEMSMRSPARASGRP